MTAQWPRRRPVVSAHEVVKIEAPRRRVLPFVWGGLKRLCMVLGALVLFSSVMSCTVLTAVMKDNVAVLPGQFVLHMPIETDYPEYREFTYGPKVPTMREVTEALRVAKTDGRVKGVVAMMRGGSLNMAHLYELRLAVKDFRESGKFAYFYVTSFAEQGQGLGSYYLASAFDEIWMQPVGALSIPGMQAEMPFARELLGKVGVTPQVFARKEYKNVFESFTAEEMSEATRTMMTALIGDIALQLRSDIAADREMAAAALQGFVDQGLILDKEALAAGLIDVLDYGDALTAKIKKDVTGDAESEDLKFVDIAGYAKHHPAAMIGKVKAEKPKKPKVALIYAVGAIVPHVQNAMAPGVFMRGGNISATAMSMTFNEAIEDEDIGVIVLRLDSPGGSPAASETLRAKILKAQEKGKVVIVSMGEVAASGGYWMAAPADRIYATPLTLTGSIGVAGGKFVIADLWEKIGVNWEDVSWGENAGIWSPNALYTDAQRARYEAMMDSVYDGFVARVAEGRKMESEKAEALARGRVWTGRQAQQNGLVDEIGGLDAALDYAARLAGAEDRGGVRLEILPKPETAWERLARLLEMQAGIGKWLSSVIGAVRMAVNADGMMLYEPVRVK